MALRSIVKWGEAVLHRPAARVETIDAAVATLVQDMVETMYAAPGIGLAAPQVGVPLRVIVIDLSSGEDRSQLITLVNPEIVASEGEQHEEEGCLSMPGFGGTPARPARVVARGTDLEGRERTFEASRLLARAFCHEIDHIDGLLFVDRLTPLKRDLLKRKLRKVARSESWSE
jgi:peptide deformylase